MSDLVTHAEIRVALREHAIDPQRWCATGALYRPVTTAWLRNQFAESFRALKAGLGVFYRPEAYNCRAYTFLAIAHAMYLHGQTAGNGEAAIAFGAFGYHKTLADGGWIAHLVALAIRRDAGRLLPVWFEPQDESVFNINREELLTCDLVII